MIQNRTTPSHPSYINPNQDIPLSLTPTEIKFLKTIFKKTNDLCKIDGSYFCFKDSTRKYLNPYGDIICDDCPVVSIRKKLHKINLSSINSTQD